MAYDKKSSKTKVSKKEQEELEFIVDRFNFAKEYFKDDYTRNKEDNEFALGEQWPQDIKNNRVQEGRPCLTENRLLPFINKTVNEIRQARPTIIVRPVDSKADPKVAEILRGIIRNIESVSDADTAYDTAAYNAVSAGYGWIRVTTEYSDYKSFDQEVRIERILNPQSVYVDPNSQRLDASDAEYIFIYVDMTRDDFTEAYPDASIESFDTADEEGEWETENNVRVAEYFYKDYKTKNLIKYRLEVAGVTETKTEYEEDMPENYKELGYIVLEEREVEVCSIKWCKLTNSEILEKSDFPGTYIPIVPVIGMETWLDNKRQVFSLIHQAKDPQRRFNYFMTASTELIALQPKAPYVGATGAFETNRRQWTDANRVNHATLEYDPVIDEETGQAAPPPVRMPPPQGSMAMTQETIGAAEGIQSVLGIYASSIGAQSNEISGKAIISRQLQGDNATYHFVDNLSTAMKQVGRILVELIALIYTEQRIVRILGEDGTEGAVALNQPVRKEGNDYIAVGAGEEGESYFNLGLGKYDVIVEVGPSFATKQQEAANAIIEIARVKPEIMEVAGDLLIKALDIPNGDEIAKRIQTTMDPALLGDDIEAQRLQGLTKENQAINQENEQLKAALEVKDDDERTKNELKSRELDIKAQGMINETNESEATVRKLNAEANIEIPAEAMKDIAQAQDIQAEELQDIRGAVEEILSHREKEAAVVPA